MFGEHNFDLQGRFPLGLGIKEVEHGFLGNARRQLIVTVSRKEIGGRSLGHQPIFEKIVEEGRTIESRAGSKPGYPSSENLESIDQSHRADTKTRTAGTYTPKDRTKEHEWLHLHRDEYAWQWVALDGDRLVSHGYNLKDVVETAKQNGVIDALFVRVEPSDALPWAGF